MERLVISLYRLCGFLHRGDYGDVLFVRVFIKVAYATYSFIANAYFGAYLPYKAIISDDVIFPHSLFGVFISEGSIIGDGCTIYHHVTIGSKYDHKTNSTVYPVIKNKVFISANACIIGRASIHDNVFIGAGCTVVDENVPEGSTVVSAKNRVIVSEK